ncbi:MAG: S49 family peptidase [Candidatus Parcubacteria bacterium]|nr:S49 family peptidase [Candidatus Parcubacteria bacterium]
MKKQAKYKTLKIAILIVLVAIISGIYVHDYFSPHVAVIPITGELVTHIDKSDDQTETDSKDVVMAIRKADADMNIKAIILEINSPGGNTVGAEEVVNALHNTKKHTISLIRSQGLSAGYMVASATNVIFASHTSMVGDIGVTQSYTDNAKANRGNGITFNQLSLGKFKDMSDPNKPLTQEEKDLITRNGLQPAYDFFVATVAENRHLSIDIVRTMADGSWVLGDQALKEKLIDKIGSFAEVKRYLEENGVSTNKIPW